MAFSWTNVDSVSTANVIKVATDKFISNGIRIGTYSGGSTSWGANQFSGLPSWAQTGVTSGRVTLSDGRFLIAGGNDGTNDVANCSIGTISGTTISWAAATPLPSANRSLEGCLLADGRVMLWGGANNPGTLFGTVSGNTVTWVASSSADLPTCYYTAHPLLLPDGRVIIVEDTFDGCQHIALITVDGTNVSYVECDTPLNVSVGNNMPIAVMGGNKILLGEGTRGSTQYNGVWMGRILANSEIAWTPETSTWLTGQSNLTAMLMSDNTVLMFSNPTGSPGTYKATYVPSILETDLSCASTVIFNQGVIPGADLVCTCSVNSDLTLASEMRTVLSCVSTISADLTSSGIFTTLQCSTTINAKFDTTLEAALSNTQTITADLTDYQAPAAELRSALSSVSSITADLTTEKRLNTALTSASSLTAALTTRIQFAANLASVSSVGADLTTHIELATALQSYSTVSVDLTTQKLLETHLTSESTLFSRLTIPIDEPFEELYVFMKPDSVHVYEEHRGF